MIRGSCRRFAMEPGTGIPMDGRDVEYEERVWPGRPPVKRIRQMPYMEVLSFDEATGRGLANLDGTLVVFEGKARREEGGGKPQDTMSELKLP